MRPSVIRTSERAAELGRLSGDARRLKREKKDAARQLLDVVRAEPIPEGALEHAAQRACLLVLEGVISGDIATRDAGQAAAFVTAAHKILRLEEGLSTSNNAHAAV